MSTHLSGVQSFLGLLHHFVLAKFATSSISVKYRRLIEKGRTYTKINAEYHFELYSAAPGDSN